MKEENINIDFLMKETLEEKELVSIPTGLKDKVMRKISIRLLWKNIFFDFGIKITMILFLLLIPISVMWIYGMNESQPIINFIKGNFIYIIGLMLITYFLIFMNELTEKYLMYKTSD